MIRFLLIAGSLLLFIAPKASRAQDNKRFVLTGIIKDSSQGTVPFATIRQLNNQQHPVQTTTAGEDGRFVIDSMLPAGFLLVSAGGYAEKTVSMAELKTGVLNVIYLQRNTLLMKGVTVSATGPLVKREADKLVYNMEADPESKFRTVLDIMKKVPFLSVDAQGNLFLKGNSGYRILVNGKPSGLMDNNAREFLKNMPASTIQNIEVYTTPPSKYKK